MVESSDAMRERKENQERLLRGTAYVDFCHMRYCMLTFIFSNGSDGSIQARQSATLLQLSLRQIAAGVSSGAFHLIMPVLRSKSDEEMIDLRSRHRIDRVQYLLTLYNAPPMEFLIPGFICYLNGAFRNHLNLNSKKRI